MVLLLILSVLFSNLTACENTQQSNDNTPEFSGVFSAEEGKFYIDKGEVFTADSGKLAFSLSAIITENYYKELKNTYGSTSAFSFYAQGGNTENPTLAETLIAPVPLEFTVENNLSILKIQGTVEIEGYNFTEEEFLSFFDDGYFGEIFLVVKYLDEKGKTVYDKITAYGKETFNAYSPDGQDISIAQFNVFILKTVESANLTLTEDIDMKDIKWCPTSRFSGTLDGNEHVIKNLRPYRRVDGVIENYGTGLFYEIGKCTIKNIGFVKAQHAEERIGILCGEVYEKLNVENVFCYIVGDVTAFSGGLVYYSVHPIDFKNVLVCAQVKGGTDLAGLFVGRGGRANFTFKNCVGIAPSKSYNEDLYGLFGSRIPGLGETVIPPTVIGKAGRDYDIFDSLESATQSTIYGNLSGFVQYCAGMYIE